MHVKWIPEFEDYLVALDPDDNKDATIDNIRGETFCLSILMSGAFFMYAPDQAKLFLDRVVALVTGDALAMSYVKNHDREQAFADHMRRSEIERSAQEHIDHSELGAGDA